MSGYGQVLFLNPFNKNRCWRSIFLTIFLILQYRCFTPVADQELIRPNIILIMCDDLGWMDVGFNGNPEIKTPNLDGLAALGLKFERFYAAAPVCSPTRSSCLTGRSPFRMGIPNANAGHLPHREITLPELLKKEDYFCGHFGKWHLGTLTKDTLDANRGGRPGQEQHFTPPSEHGYDTYFCTESKVPTHDPMIKPVDFDRSSGESLRYGWRALRADQQSEFYGTFYWSDHNGRETTGLQGDDAEILTDKVISFVDASLQRQQSFFASLWFHTPHLPLVCADSFRHLYSGHDLKKQLLYGSITAMDQQIGRLANHLRSQKIFDNTLIWFCSDNGPENDTPGSAGPYRERKRSLYEGGLRVPSFICWPLHVAAGSKTSSPVVTSDFLPTIAGFLNTSYPDPARPLDGVDLSQSILKNTWDEDRAIGFRYRDDKASWMTNQYKLISTDTLKTFELYDLLKDPSETEDIYSQNVELAQSMRTDLFLWLKSCKDSENGQDYR